MAANDFTFISPGVFTNEIDQSQYGQGPVAVGPAIIGRFPKGPGMIPTQVNSYEQFVSLFGEPESGNDENSWRGGNHSAVTYGSWAAKAWLKNSSPVTIVRLVGQESDTQASNNTGVQAGWKTTNPTASMTDYSQNGGAFGLFIIPSGTTGATTQNFGQLTGTLAAVWYLDGANTGIALSGSSMSSSYQPLTTNGVGHPTASVSAFFKNSAAGGTFSVLLYSGSTDSTGTKYSFNFDASSDNFIRDVFNTDPTKTNSGITTTTEAYWLGETFEDHISKITTKAATGNTENFFGIILSLHSGSVAWADHYGQQATSAQSGWVISQDTATTDGTGFNVARDPTKLFKFHTLNGDDWAQRNIKIAISSIAQSANTTAEPYGTFTVEVRRLYSDDGAASVEVFDNCSLDPNKSNYIAKKIGDQYPIWDDTLKRNRMRGRYANRSAYIRVEMAQESFSPPLLPWGFEGPTRPRGFQITSGTVAAGQLDGLAGGALNTWVSGGFYQFNADTPVGPTPCRIATPGGWGASSGTEFFGMAPGCVANFKFPDLLLVESASAINDATTPIAAQSIYWGMRTKVAADKRNNLALKDIVVAKPDGIDGFSTVDPITGLIINTIFTLDNVSGGVDGGPPVYVSGSRAAKTSLTSVNTSVGALLGDIGGLRADRFSLPLFGGTAGFDITESDPFNNTDLGSDNDGNNAYVYSLGKAIDLIASTEDVAINMAAMPGITHAATTKKLIARMQTRGDALGIIDLEGGFKPRSETRDRDAAATYGTVKTTVSSLKTRALNNSYGAAYYPWVQASEGGNNFWLPPSVAAMAALSHSDKVSDLWFAPAGFNRGGIDGGAAKYGIDIVGTADSLTASDRDTLYEVNINPIANFVSEGIVVFGQKTLQVTKSALDRINVRRLLIYLKRHIADHAKGILFEQNIESTWATFANKVNPFLAGVKAGGGLVDYKLILDRTTTTPDLIDQNVMYAKIVIKPAKAIEFILLDFVITNQGAVFTS